MTVVLHCLPFRILSVDPVSPLFSLASLARPIQIPDTSVSYATTAWTNEVTIVILLHALWSWFRFGTIVLLCSAFPLHSSSLDEIYSSPSAVLRAYQFDDWHLISCLHASLVLLLGLTLFDNFISVLPSMMLQDKGFDSQLARDMTHYSQGNNCKILIGMHGRMHPN